MLYFEHEKGKFQYRTAGVVLRDEHVLLNTFSDDNYWFLPGGRVEMGEPADLGVVREIYEELGLVATVTHPLFLIENLYENGGQAYHELCICFLLEITGELPFGEDIVGIEEDENLIYRWFSFNELSTLDLRPAILKTKLRHLGDEFEYLS